MNQEEYYALSIAENEHWWYLSLKDRLNDLFKTAVNQNDNDQLSVLDIGCGTGGNLDFLKRKFESIGNWQGCEPNNWACKYSRMRGLTVELSSIEGYQTHEKFDIVLLIDVIYHRHINPRQALSKIHQLMKPNGILIINSAAMPCLRRPHDVNVMGARRFMRHDLIRLCKESKFDLIDAFYWNSLLTPFLFISILINRLLTLIQVSLKLDAHYNTKSEVLHTNSLLNAPMSLILKLEFHLHKQMIRLPWGSSIMYMGRKI